jgi:hypothetical protein
MIHYSLIDSSSRTEPADVAHEKDCRLHLVVLSADGTTIIMSSPNKSLENNLSRKEKTRFFEESLFFQRGTSSLEDMRKSIVNTTGKSFDSRTI